jgi:predicted aspartyl protease
MLLKFSKADILNSSLVYPDTGALGYTILTRSHFIRAGDKDSDTESEDEAVETRRTIIYNKNGISMAGIVWEGRRPVEITIGQEKINVKGMFGCQSAILSYVASSPSVLMYCEPPPLRHNILGIPARFDTEFFWMAAPDGLTVSATRPCVSAAPLTTS